METSEVREGYSRIGNQVGDAEREIELRAEFDVWLERRDAEMKAALLDELAADWAADPDSWGDNEKDYRNELRDRAELLRNASGD